jgi:hypothetical protein
VLGSPASGGSVPSGLVTNNTAGAVNIATNSTLTTSNLVAVNISGDISQATGTNATAAFSNYQFPSQLGIYSFLLGETITESNIYRSDLSGAVGIVSGFTPTNRSSWYYNPYGGTPSYFTNNGAGSTWQSGTNTAAALAITGNGTVIGNLNVGTINGHSPSDGGGMTNLANSVPPGTTTNVLANIGGSGATVLIPLANLPAGGTMTATTTITNTVSYTLTGSFADVDPLSHITISQPGKYDIVGIGDFAGLNGSTIASMTLWNFTTGLGFGSGPAAEGVANYENMTVIGQITISGTTSIGCEAVDFGSTSGTVVVTIKVTGPY